MFIDYAEINSRAVNMLLSSKKHISSIPPELKSLVELRVSQINRCAYCLDLHSKEARREGASQQKLDCLPAASESGLFTPKELSALAWAEKITNIQNGLNQEMEVNALFDHFNQEEIVDLTLVIALMNCLNRLAISMGDRPR
ncbi:MAG: carboxymuconolactone decarboxylase family protein [Granulosicoccus sp.]